MDSLSIKAYAKINLFLDVVSRAENGYHEVRTVMQTLSLCDDIEVSLNGEGGISISCDDARVPTDERNLAWRAAELFFEASGRREGADIRIKKRIPMAAGLAGGSSDAAATLSALNALCGYPLVRDELLSLGARLGADVPFCIEGGTKYADGFGEKLHPFANMPSAAIVVACAGEGVSTPLAYGELDRRYSDFADGAYQPRSLASLEEALRCGELKSIGACLYNIFESVIEPERPEVTRIKSVMREQGAIAAMMSGSGPSVFGIFPDKRRAEQCVSALSALGIGAHYAEPVGGNS